MIINLAHFENWLISPYMILMILSILVGVTYIAHKVKTENKVPASYIAYMTYLNATCIVITGITFGIIINFPNWKEGLGFTSIGGALGLAIAALVNSSIFKEVKTTIIKQSIAITSIMYSISKLGCMLAGCCKGIEIKSNVLKPLLITYIKDNKTTESNLINIQLIESITFFIMFIIFQLKINISNSTKIVIMAVSKFLLDFLRYTHAERLFKLTKNQVLCILIVILAILLKNKIDVKD